MFKSDYIRPSAADRWMNCPGSVILCEKIKPPYTESEYAKEGTAAHKVCELMLLGKRVPKTIEGVPVTPEMREHAKNYKSFVMSMVKESKGELLVEQKGKVNVHTDYGYVEIEGTADAVIKTKQEIIVIDFKYGKGVKVDAGSFQLFIYGLCTLNENGFGRALRTIVYQPRIDNIDEKLYTPKDISAIGAMLSDKLFTIQEMYEGSTSVDYNPGEKQCKFCPVKAHCPAIKNEIMESAKIDFADTSIEPLQPGAMTTAQLQKALDAIPLLSDWMTAVQDHARSEILAGKKIPGYKLIKTFSNTKYIDEKAVERKFKRSHGEKIYSAPKLLSPAQLKKVVGEKALKPFTERLEKAPALVPESHKGPEYGSAQNDFGIIDA